jgi:hypothetical protein
VTVLSPAQIAAYARAAGFRGAGLTWAVAVALAESGGRTDATLVNHDRWHSVDRGLWQINNHWHPEVSDAQAFDPAQAAAAAYRISHGGTSWTPWATFNNGSAGKQIGRARLAAAAPAPKTPGVGSTGGGSTPGNTSSSSSSATAAPGAQNASLGGDLLGGLGGAGTLLPFGGGGLGGAVLNDLQNGGNPLSGINAVGKAAVNMVKLSAELTTALFDPHTYVRGAYIGLGAAAVLMGAYLLAKSGEAGSTLQGAAKSAGGAAKGAARAAAEAAAA